MLRKNALSSTSSTDCAAAEGRISLRLNQSANAIGRKWPTSITSVAWPLITAEPRMPSALPATSMWSRSSTMSMISSTTRPIERPSSANTRIGWAPEVWTRSEEHTSELQSRSDLVCRLLLEKKKKNLQQQHLTPNKQHERNTHH